MRIAVMQPYLFPYIGYFQLVNACDEFIVYDDVQYIKRGWVNRNQILGANGELQKFTAPVIGASQTKTFNDVTFATQDRLLETLASVYRKAPNFDAVQPLVERVLRHEDRRTASLIAFSLHEIHAYLGVDCLISLASSLKLSSDLRGEARILAICRSKGATAYVNLPGGTGLYEAESFKRHGVELSFLRSGVIQYSQFEKTFVPNLSIIDVLMFNAPQQIRSYLTRYELFVA